MTAARKTVQAADWQRARKPGQKASRRKLILEAAYTLFHDLDYEEVSLNAIAREAGLSKSSVYLYFQTREDIFLDIFMDTFRHWFGASRTALQRLKVSAPPAEVAAAWVSVTWKHKRMRSLAPLLATSIERHASEERLADCLRMKMEECARMRETLARFFPAITGTQVFDLMLYLFSLFAQFVAYERNAGLEKARQHPEFTAAPWNYQQMAAHALTLVLENMVRKASNA